MVGSEEIVGRGIKVTIKYGKGYEETWASFGGLLPEVREDIIGYFGFDSASVSGLTLDGLVLNATQVAHAKGNLGAQLGAVAIPNSGSTTDEAQADPWAAAAAEAQAPADPHKHLFDAVASISDVEKLKLLWAENTQAFTENSALLDAYKARGKALSS